MLKMYDLFVKISQEFAVILAHSYRQNGCNLINSPNLTMVIKTSQFLLNLPKGHSFRNKVISPCVHLKTLICLFMVLLE